ncbi:MAG: DUF58 domain-containing protein [Thermofilaceae archaeon]
MKLLLYFALIASLLAVTMFLGELNSLAVVALTIPPVLMIGFSSLFSADINVRAERELESIRVFKGDTLKVGVKVFSNTSSLIEVKDSVDPKAKVVKGFPKALINLKGYADFSYEIKLPARGSYSLGPIVVSASDPLGLWERVKVMGPATKVVAFPQITGESGISLRAKYTGVWPGEVLSKHSGGGTEFYGVREYVYGDELKRINWRATARLARLISNDYVEERVTDVLLVVDAGFKGILEDSEALELADVEISAAASIAFHLLRTGNRVSLISRGRGRAWLRPGFGKRQLLAILYSLSELEIGEPAPMDFAVRMLAPYLLKPNAEIIVISPLLDSIFAKSLLDLAGEYSLLIVSPNPFPIKGGLAREMLALERDNLIIGLSRACRVIDWIPGSPLTRTVKRL